MAKKKEEVIEQNNAYVPKKTNRGLIAFLIVLAIIVVIASIALPFLFIFGLAFIFDGDLEYDKVNEQTISIKEIGMNVSVEDTSYDKEDKCFILSTKIEKSDKSKKNNLFDYDSVDVTYIFKDKEGFIVGSESLYVENINKYDKWKQNVYYCGPNADEVAAYEVESVIAN